jgi:hypothetical protein
VKRLLLVIVALLVGCEPGEFGNLCNQRYRLYFAGMIADSEYKHCENFDLDDDDVVAPYDRDDRLDKYGDHGPDGSGIGDIAECRAEDPDPENDTYTEYDWDCIRSYWSAELERLCGVYEDGDPDGEFEYGEQEDAAYEEYCR